MLNVIKSRLSGRTMKILILLIMLFAANILTAQKENRKTETFQVSKDGELEVYTNPGDITIETWDKNEVVVLAEEPPLFTKANLLKYWK